MAYGAFFDLDNTVVRGSSLYPFALRLLRSGILNTVEVMRFASINKKFVKTRTESLEGRDYVVARALSLVSGRTVSEMNQLCDDMVPRIVKKRANPRVLQEIEHYRSLGFETWLVTASPIELAQRFASELDMTGALGTRAHHTGGFYTGELSGPILHGPHKALAVSALASERGIDLTGSVAFSDSINDLPLLAMVGYPTIVNSNRELRLLARRNGWRELERVAESPPLRRG